MLIDYNVYLDKSYLPDYFSKLQKKVDAFRERNRQIDWKPYFKTQLKKVYAGVVFTRQLDELRQIENWNLPSCVLHAIHLKIYGISCLLWINLVNPEHFALTSEFSYGDHTIFWLEAQKAIEKMAHLLATEVNKA